MTIKVYNDEQELNIAAAKLIIDLAHGSIEKTGRFVIALSGGVTPSSLYNLLAHLPYSKEMPWKETFVFWSDERCVPSDSEQNNSHLARRMMLDHIPIPAENVFPVQVHMAAEKAAMQYENMIKAFFKNDNPSFDLVLLGLGKDGHIASLFPGNMPPAARLVISSSTQGENSERITFTPLLINNARHVLFLVSGKNKSDILKKAIKEKKITLPVHLIKPQKGKLLWYADAAAASELKSK